MKKLSIPRVNLHPASCKYLKLGHPWITDDSFTKKFPQNSFFLIGVDEKSKQDIALILHDPEHKTVKARLWSLDKNEWELSFEEQVCQRLKKAISSFDLERLWKIQSESFLK